MFKKNPNRPPIVISLKKVNAGYKVQPNDSYNPFSFKRITRAIFRSDLYHSNPLGQDHNLSGFPPGSAMIQAPSHLTIPLSAKWFDADKIHEIEREAFPQFFLQQEEDGKIFKKSPKSYKIYRNSIYTLWKQNSKKYLSPALCRKNLPGDVSSIMRIHAFLEHWGLINFPSKEHSKGFVHSKTVKDICLMCHSESAYEYYVAQIEEETMVQLCNICYQNKLFPDFLQDCDFRKIVPEQEEKKRIEKKMSHDEIQKMVHIIQSESREKQIWTNLGKAFPNYNREELILNFLQLPLHLKSNANIFEDHEDFINEIDPPSQDSPTIFEDFQNPEQAGIAMAYYAWKSRPQKYPKLQQLFESAVLHAQKLGKIQSTKSHEMLRMLTDLQQSKIELKSIFIQELEKLSHAEKTYHRNVALNTIAESIKNKEIGE